MDTVPHPGNLNDLVERLEYYIARQEKLQLYCVPIKDRHEIMMAALTINAFRNVQVANPDQRLRIERYQLFTFGSDCPGKF